MPGDAAMGGALGQERGLVEARDPDTTGGTIAKRVAVDRSVQT